MIGVAALAYARESPKVLYIYGYIDGDGNRPEDTGYDGTPFHPMRLDNISPTSTHPDNTDFDRGMSGFREALEEKDLDVTQQIDSAITLDDSTLEDVA